MIQQPKITVLAPARLHMGFIDLSNSLGRQFGSIGLKLNEYATHLSLSPSKKQLITGMSDVRAKIASGIIIATTHPLSGNK
jgi:predicted sugar kinase